MLRLYQKASSLLLCKKEFSFQEKMQLIHYNVAVYETILKFSKLKAYLYFFLLFLPSYSCKILKRKLDSRQYMSTLNVL